MQHSSVRKHIIIHLLGLTKKNSMSLDLFEKCNYHTKKPVTISLVSDLLLSKPNNGPGIRKHPAGPGGLTQRCCDGVGPHGDDFL